MSVNMKNLTSDEKSDGSMSTYHDNKYIYPDSHIYFGLL